MRKKIVIQDQQANLAQQPAFNPDPYIYINALIENLFPGEPEIKTNGIISIKFEGEGIVIDIWNHNMKTLLSTTSVWYEDLYVENEDE